jgi:hypothetical protein
LPGAALRTTSAKEFNAAARCACWCQRIPAARIGVGLSIGISCGPLSKTLDQREGAAIAL